ncbi:MAG: hypothetical protein IJD22_01755 [Clostridia bacterium]|nr:hypothetical protein [Clostridia bacterium]
MFDLKTYYTNFALDNSSVSLTVIVFAICIGLAIGVIFYAFSRYSAGRIVKALSVGKNNSGETAVTLADLGIKASSAVRRSLKDGQPLRKYILIANEDECRIESKKGFFNSVYKFFRSEDIPSRIDLSKALFYLPEDSRPTAQVRFEAKPSSIIAAFIFAVLFIACAVGISLCLPKLLELIDTMISAYKKL